MLKGLSEERSDGQEISMVQILRANAVIHKIATSFAKYFSEQKILWGRRHLQWIIFNRMGIMCLLNFIIVHW